MQTSLERWFAQRSPSIRQRCSVYGSPKDTMSPEMLVGKDQMGTVGIIVNPASGRDIRRLVAYATTIDNQEKVNIVKRIVLAAQRMGTERFLFMPDTFRCADAAIDTLTLDGSLHASCSVLQMPYEGSAEDTVKAAGIMEQEKIGCLIVLGGDGTCRAAAKGITEVPILPVSTGTNNVYPQMVEGTVAGMAAGLVAGSEEYKKYCIRDKRIEIFINGEFCDSALVDAVISRDRWIGSRAIWDASQIEMLVVTRAHPASIGFSAIAGCFRMVSPEDEQGMMLEFAPSTEKNKATGILAPVSAGMIDEVYIRRTSEIPLGQSVEIKANEDCMIALDGEREIRVYKDDSIAFRIARTGPKRVIPRSVLEAAVLRGDFRIP